MESVKVAVVGSANMDLVFGCKRFPKPGETIIGESFVTVPGGKGANQCVAIAMLGGTTSFIGKVGSDGFGDALLNSLQTAGARTNLAHRTPDFPSGVAGILVDSFGQNSIIVAPGSNAQLTGEEVANALAKLNATIVLVQLEVSDGAVEACLGSKKVILNPAPARPLSDSVYCGLFAITPNETEAELLTGIAPIDEPSCLAAADWFRKKGVQNVIITLGSKGCFLSTPEGFQMIQPYKVDPIDTVAAGDAFNGALALFTARGESMSAAARKANAAGALSTTKRGAQTSMPTMSELEEFLATADLPTTGR